MSNTNTNACSRTLCARRAWITLELKKIPFRYRQVPLIGFPKPADFLKLNPRGQVPTLQVDDHIIRESVRLECHQGMLCCNTRVPYICVCVFFTDMSKMILISGVHPVREADRVYCTKTMCPCTDVPTLHVGNQRHLGHTYARRAVCFDPVSTPYLMTPNGAVCITNGFVTYIYFF